MKASENGNGSATDVEYRSKKRVMKGYEAMKAGADPHEAVRSMVAPNPSAVEFLAEAASKPKGQAPILVVPVNSLNIGTISVRIEGVTPLICNAWSEKAIGMMRDKQTQVRTGSRASKVQREAKDPEADFRDSLHGPFADGKYGFPAIAFKQACVTACLSMGEDITKTQIRQAFHVAGESPGGQYAILEGTPVRREDMVRLRTPSGPVADIRYRGEFPTWATTLIIRYNEVVIRPTQILDLLNVAGFGVGIGEWRPEKEGANGQFSVIL